jgi:hypothetical protein
MELSYDLESFEKACLLRDPLPLGKSSSERGAE